MIPAIYANSVWLNWSETEHKVADYSPKPSRFKKFVASVAKKMIEADRKYRDMQKLRNMPDYLLRDLGINRSDIQRRSALEWLMH